MAALLAKPIGTRLCDGIRACQRTQLGAHLA